MWVVYHRPSGPSLLARWLLLSLWISIQSSPRSSWRSIRCNSFCGVFVEIRWIVGLWSSLSMRNIWISSEFFYVWLSYLFKSLRIISLVWPTRLIFLAMGDVLSFGFNIAVFDLSDRKGTDTYCIVAIEDKKMGFISYCMSLTLYIMSSFLMLLCSSWT